LILLGALLPAVVAILGLIGCPLMPTVKFVNGADPIFDCSSGPGPRPLLQPVLWIEGYVSTSRHLVDPMYLGGTNYCPPLLRAYWSFDIDQHRELSYGEVLELVKSVMVDPFANATVDFSLMRVQPAAAWDHSHSPVITIPVSDHKPLELYNSH